MIDVGDVSSVLETPIFWLDASDTDTIILNGADVAQWNDKGSLGENLVQGTAGLQPTYQATGWTGGLPTVYFGGAGDPNYLGVTKTPKITTLDISIFAVVRPAATNGCILEMSKGNVTGTDKKGHSLYYESGPGESIKGRVQNDSDVYYTSTVLASIDTDYVAAFKSTFANITAYATDTSGILDATFGNNLVDNFRLSGFQDDTFHWEGLISEIIVYNFALNKNQTASVIAALKTKWGI